MSRSPQSSSPNNLQRSHPSFLEELDFEYNNEVSSFEWSRYQPFTLSYMSLNSPLSVIEFDLNLTDRYYLIDRARLYINLQIGPTSGSNTTNGAIASNASYTNQICFVPDSLFSYTSVSINSVPVADPYGRDQYSYLRTHLLKKLSYSKNYAEMVEDAEYFYDISDGVGGLPNCNENSLMGYVGTVASTVISGGNVPASGAGLVLTLNGLTESSSVQDVLQASSGTNNPTPAYMSKNQSYNNGFYKATQTSTNPVNTSFCIEAPLIYTNESLLGMRGPQNGFTFRWTGRLNPTNMMTFSNSSVPSFTAFISDVWLDIPNYSLSEAVNSQIVAQKLNYRQKLMFFPSWALIRNQTPIAPGSTSLSLLFPGAFRRPSLAAYVFFRYAAETNNGIGNQNGNIYRFINPGPVSDYLLIGGSTKVPHSISREVRNNNSFQVIYRDFLKTLGLWNEMRDVSKDTLITYKKFIRNCFMYPYDLTDISSKVFEYDTAPKDMLFNINVSPTGFAPTNANAALTGAAPGGNVEAYLLLGDINAIRICSERNNNTSIEALVPVFNALASI